MNRASVLVAALLLATALIVQGRPGTKLETEPVRTATFSIAAIDSETGECGAAVASKANDACKYVAHARPGVGVFCTQHYSVKEWGAKALDMLADKKLPEEVFTDLLKNDKYAGGRQLAIIDMKGRSAQRHPATTTPSGNYWGGMSGRFYVCQGNMLTGRGALLCHDRSNAAVTMNRTHLATIPYGVRYDSMFGRCKIVRFPK